MKEYYYIARRKQRGLSLRYAGDGIITASNAKEAKELVAMQYGVAKQNVKLQLRKG